MIYLDKLIHKDKFDITYYKVSNLPFSIVHLSDLHNSQDDRLILNAIEYYKPEIAVVTGDIVGKNLEFEKKRQELLNKEEKIKEKMACDGFDTIFEELTKEKE